MEGGSLFSDYSQAAEKFSSRVDWGLLEALQLLHGLQQFICCVLVHRKCGAAVVSGAACCSCCALWSLQLRHLCHAGHKMIKEAIMHVRPVAFVRCECVLASVVCDWIEHVYMMYVLAYVWLHTCRSSQRFANSNRASGSLASTSN